jgi:hypothetical protein
MESFNTDDRGMTRRKLVGGVVAGGVAGILGGAGTWALTHDREGVSTQLTGGSLRLEATCGETAGCTTTEQGVRVEIGPTEPPANGVARLRLRVAGAAAHVWLRTTPPAGTQLEEETVVTLQWNGQSVQVDDTPVEQWSLARVLTTFADGRPLTPAESPVSADTNARITLRWSVPEDIGLASTSRSSPSVTLAAVQHRPESPLQNPWTGDLDE